DDYIAIRWMAYFALSFDHRVIDGADAERFLAYVKEQVEAGEFSL
ncbi:MAG: 2-oxo acid dehydrogenase subunit E2, partial [Pyrinomonadaceae bacterium]